jgi:hypothetical protein
MTAWDKLKVSAFSQYMSTSWFNVLYFKVISLYFKGYYKICSEIIQSISLSEKGDLYIR